VDQRHRLHHGLECRHVEVVGARDLQDLGEGLRSTEENAAEGARIASERFWPAS
jgi:hypothetical protein